jgi:hypothetical protein
MACALTQGYSLDCRDSLGGIVEVYFTEAANVTATTEASGVITALTKAAGKRFWKYALVKDTSMFNQTMTASVANGTVFYGQELQIILNKPQTNTRNELLLLAQNSLVAVAKDSNGIYWYLGKTRGIDMTANAASTGTAQGDRSGFTLTFTGSEPALAPSVLGTVASALETPGS